jgi:hypothetical protein
MSRWDILLAPALEGAAAWTRPRPHPLNSGFSSRFSAYCRESGRPAPREIPSRCALLEIDAGGRYIFRLMTPVGVFAFASCLNSFTSCGVQGSRERRLYLGFALRGPFLPIGEPDRFRADCAMWSSKEGLGHESAHWFL